MVAASNKTERPLRSFVERRMRIRERLYAIVDAARDSDLAFAARDRFGLELHSLFEGRLAEHLDHVAPHLIPVNGRWEFLDFWSGHLGHSAGVLLITSESTGPLHAHLRDIFVVEDEESREYSFRYFDPRVLRVYLPTCTGAEARAFFGPVRQILVEGESAGSMLCCEAIPSGVRMDEKRVE